MGAELFKPEYRNATVEQALEWFRQKAVITDEEFYALEERSRTRAFAVSDLADLDIATDVWEALDSAISNGTDFDTFKAEIQEKLESEWGGENPARLENIFRTNIQSAYSAGRYIQNNKPEVLESHPYSKFLAIEDDRTTDLCASLDGTCLPSDDAFWATHQPPLHFNCRSDVVALTEAEAREEGIDAIEPHNQADEGFGQPLAALEPDLDGRPAELVNLYELKQLE